MAGLAAGCFVPVALRRTACVPGWIVIIEGVSDYQSILRRCRFVLRSPGACTKEILAPASWVQEQVIPKISAALAEQRMAATISWEGEKVYLEYTPFAAGTGYVRPRLAGNLVVSISTARQWYCFPFPTGGGNGSCGSGNGRRSKLQFDTANAEIFAATFAQDSIHFFGQIFNVQLRGIRVTHSKAPLCMCYSDLTI